MKGNLEIHSENILPIIKKWLYSDRDIFVRELTSNASDACEKLRVLQVDGPFSIEVRTDAEKGTIEFEDNGIGMSREEVQKYIAQIAFSGAEEFAKQYKEGDQLIGHFGLGFYSAYMVAKKVEIETLSYQKDSTAVFWSCDGSIDYDMEEGKREKRGTLIRLILADDVKEYLEKHKLQEILTKYCKFFSIPISLNGERINEKEPLWIKNPKECKKEEYLEFYRQLYPFERDPLCWIHLNVDYPFHLKGILYFPKMRSVPDWHRHSVQLFCNRVFVQDHCKEILPEYLTQLRGVIDSPDIPLNVSRSFLQMDATVKMVATHISKKVSDSLGQLYKEDKAQFIQDWEDIGFILKLGAIQDEKFFARVKEILIFKNVKGEYLTLDEYTGKQSGKVYYTKEPKQPLAELYTKKGIEILILDHPYDLYLIPIFEKEKHIQFQRIDGGLDESLCVPPPEHQSAMAQFFQSQLQEAVVETKHLSETTLPGFVQLKEEERRLRDFMRMQAPNTPLPLKPTFILNTASPLVESIYGLREKDPDLSQELVRTVYELSLLGQKEMDHEQLPSFIERSQKILAKLLQ